APARGRLDRHLRPDHAAEREVAREVGVAAARVGVEALVAGERADDDRVAPHRPRLVLEVAAEAGEERPAGPADGALLRQDLERRGVARVRVERRLDLALGGGGGGAGEALAAPPRPTPAGPP